MYEKTLTPFAGIRADPRCEGTNQSFTDNGQHTLSFSGKPLLLERYVISGLIWGNELAWISDLRNVKTVIKDGQVYDPVALRRLVGFAK